MTSHEYGPPGDRRLTPADVRRVRFPRAPMLRPGYSEVEVDRFLSRLAGELDRLHAEKAELRDQVHALQNQVAGAGVHEPPSEQAVRILATAQQTADSYVAEAEDFSRQMTADARAQYEEQLRLARENAAAIIQAAQEAAAQMAAIGTQPGPDAGERSRQDLEDQVAYLKAFAQACRVQLRAYLEALLSDVETEWGRADPASLPRSPRRPAAQGADAVEGQPAPSASDAARAADAQPEGDRAGGGNGGSEVLGPRR